MAIAIHGSTPAVVENSLSTTTTASFTPPASSLIVAFGLSDDYRNTITMSASTMTLTRFFRSNNVKGAEAWIAITGGTSPGATTVSMTSTGGAVLKRISVIVFTGASYIGATSWNNQYTSTVDGSWAWSAVVATSGTVTVGAGHTLQDADVSGGFDTNLDAFVFYKTAVTPTAGTVVTNTFSSPSSFWDMCTVEILPPNANKPMLDSASAIDNMRGNIFLSESITTNDSLIKFNTGTRDFMPSVSVRLYPSGDIRTNITALAPNAWLQLNSDDIKSISITRGYATEIDQPQLGTCTIVFDNFEGWYDPLNTKSIYYPYITLSKPIQIIATWQGISYYRFSGWISNIVPDYGNDPFVTITVVDSFDQIARAYVLPLQVTDATGAVIPYPQFEGDDTATRILRILAATGYQGTVALDPGNSLCQATAYGDFGLPLIQKVVDTELGYIFSGRDGTFFFYSRYAATLKTRSTTVQAVFSDLGGDIDYNGLVITKNADTIFNDCIVTRDTPPSAPLPPGTSQNSYIPAPQGTDVPTGTPVKPQQTTDTTSSNLYGKRTFSASIGALLTDDSYALGMTQYIVNRYKNPVTIISAIDTQTIVQGMWPIMIDLTLFDRIRVKRSYGISLTVIPQVGGYNTGGYNGSYAGSTYIIVPNSIDIQRIIIGYKETITPESWEFSFDTVDPSRLAGYNFILDTSLLDAGQVGF